MDKKNEFRKGNFTRRLLAGCVGVAVQMFAGITMAQNDQVRVQLSSREAWVGAPVILQIEIRDADDYSLPEMPVIDGLAIRAAGAPSVSTQIQIGMGRRLESSSVTMQYQLTPHREGEFEIPPLVLQVDGKEVRTRPLKFVATKSETGDLLFVELSGKQDRVYVGQPLDLTLKIWIKPYRDREANLTLSEANMWQMISDQSRWGGFLERMQELARSRQRPAGQEVLRKDAEGNQRSYYLYEIESTVYPKQTGSIGADEVQIVVNYPQSLGRSRDPFDDIFGGSLFGGSAFGNRLSVTSSRPVIAAVSVDSIEVLPVPTEGRPADYRGAVGQYQIVSQAEPATVGAGDPIELRIGVVGDGPMELVQAPPLASLPELTGDFKVADQPLAGFVQDNTKVFSTTVRPRREGITQIPAIPFSFFDPVREQFQTVYSQPIPIQVDAAESLALDAIVSAQRGSTSPDESLAGRSSKSKPDFTNTEGPELLRSVRPVPISRWWIFSLVIPPMVLILVLLCRSAAAALAFGSRLQPARRMGIRRIDAAGSPDELAEALVRYLIRRMRLDSDSPQAALGALRVAGLYELAARIDGFLDSCAGRPAGPAETGLEPARNTARELVAETERELAHNRHSRVRPGANQRRLNRVTRQQASRPVASAILIAICFAASANGDTAGQDEASRPNSAAGTAGTITLDPEQQTRLLDEANELYSRATQLAGTEQVESREMFAEAAGKYQLLADAGIENARLYANLANALLQSDQPGRAIANYLRSLKLDPSNRQVRINLDFARTLVAKPVAESGSNANGTAATMGWSWSGFRSLVRWISQQVLTGIGRLPILLLVALSSILFWGLLVARAIGYRLAVFRWAIIPGLVLVLSAGVLGSADNSQAASQSAVVVVDSVTLHSGDGNQFETVATISPAIGLEVGLVARRGDWSRVRTATGQEGWVETATLEVL